MAMTDGGGWQPIPTHLRPYRDKLRIVGFDLVRVSAWEAKDRALRYYGHHPRDYEYTIYPIAYIDETSGQVYLSGSLESSHYFSESDAPLWANYRFEQEAPVSLLKDLRDNSQFWLSLGILTAIVPPYALVLFGLVRASEYRKRRDARRRARLLPRLLDMPRFA